MTATWTSSSPTTTARPTCRGTRPAARPTGWPFAWKAASRTGTAPESRLRTGRAWRDRSQASQTTIDRALRELEKEGLIRREQGRGMFATGAAPVARSLKLEVAEDLDALEQALVTHAIGRFECAER